MIAPLEIKSINYQHSPCQKNDLIFLNQVHSEAHDLISKEYNNYKIKKNEPFSSLIGLFQEKIQKKYPLKDDYLIKLHKEYKAEPFHFVPEVLLSENTSFIWELIMKGEAHILYEILRSEPSPNHEAVKVGDSQAKTEETSYTEAILFHMLDHFDDYEIDFCLGQAFIKYQGFHLRDPESKDWLELGQLFRKTNFNQITFNAERLQKASLLLKLERLTVSEFAHMAKTETHLLTDLEKGLIHDYTVNGYVVYNRFLQGRFLSLMERMPCFSYSLKLLFLKSAILVSALNKLPDYVNLQRPFLYRMEKDPPSEVIEERIRAVKAGGLTTSPYGLTSTSAEKPESGWKSRRVVIIYLNAKGKNIRHFSAMPEEREVVLPPTHIRWLYHLRISVNKNNKEIFFAKAVSEPIVTSQMN